MKRLTARQLLARSVVGEGLEIGPGDSPFPLAGGGTTVRYVDRWLPEDNARLFPELGNTQFNKPDFVADLNIERLSTFEDASQDFVIASHVFEHLVEPLGQIADAWRVLRPGGTLLVFLPDRRRTFDRNRQPTSLSHLVEEYERGVNELDDAHLIEFIDNVPEDWGDAPPPRDQAERFERHRRRSIHVHCWSEAEFLEVLLHMIEKMDTPWELIDRLVVEDVPSGIEFGIALRRPTVSIPNDVAAARFRLVWEAMTVQADESRTIAGLIDTVHQVSEQHPAQLHNAKEDLHVTHDSVRSIRLAVPSLAHLTLNRIRGIRRRLRRIVGG